jgi:hypothetical protein
MVNETKMPVVSRAEVTAGLRLCDSLIAKLQEMRQIAATLLERSEAELIEMTHREGLRMVTLRDEIGELIEESGK